MRVGVVLLALVALPVAGLVLGGEALLNSGAVRGRVAAAAARAAGHEVRLGGPLGIAWSLAPALSARDVDVLNPPGFSRPALATVRRVEARVALWPLLSGRVEVPEVRVEGADVRLERDAAGRGNWERPPAPAGGGAPGVPQARARPVVGRVEVVDSRVAWAGSPPLEVAGLAMSGGGEVEGRMAVRGVGFAVAGRVGPVDGAPKDGAPVPVNVTPVNVTLVGGGLAASAVGDAGGALAVQVLVPDLAALGGLAGRPLPAVRDVALTLRLPAGPGGVTGLRLLVGESALGGGVRLARLEAVVDGPEAPLRVTAEGAVRALPLLFAANVAEPAALLRGGATAFQALMLGDGGQVAAQGTAGPDGAFDAAVTGAVPDLGRAGALAGVPLPALRDVSLGVRALAGPGGGVVLRGLRLASAQGDVAGDLALGLAPRPSLGGTLQSRSLDIDALLDVAAAVPGAPAPAPGVAAGPAPAPAAAPLIPALPLPFAALRTMDVDLRLAVALAVLGGQPWRGAEARVLLHDGQLKVDPAQVAAPGGPIQASVVADAGQESAAVTLRGVGLDAAALGGRGGPLVSGALDVDVALAGRGADLRAFLAGANGHVGVALIDGEVENAALLAAFGSVLRVANVPIEAEGRSRLRCLAARVDLAGGTARVASLALDATRLRLEGEGTVNLLNETMDLHLRPTVRIGPAGVVVPVQLSGPLGAPRPALERGAIAPGRLGFSIGPRRSGDPCPAALLAARGRAGPEPAP